MNSIAQFQLPRLPYAYDALEPHIDGATMLLHHTKHHQGYVDKLNAGLASLGVSSTSIREVLEKWSMHAVIRNNGGGHFNHSLFWTIMSPNPKEEPTGPLSKDIKRTFGGLENFQERFSEAAAAHFGSGWAWLTLDEENQLYIHTTPNQDNPLMSISSQKGTPILGLDLWEHAYYLQYKNRRAAYIEAFWQVLNWSVVEEYYQKAVVMHVDN